MKEMPTVMVVRVKGGELPVPGRIGLVLGLSKDALLLLCKHSTFVEVVNLGSAVCQESGRARRRAG